MGEAIGGSLVMAIGVALSPVPIIAVVLMLTTPRARTNGPLFVLGWLIGLGVVGGIALGIAGPTNASQSGTPATWVSWLEILLAVLLFVVALRQLRGRPGRGEDAATPKWMGKIESMKPGVALGLGAILAGVNPKNLLLSVAAAAAIAQTGIPGGQQALSYLVFAMIASVGVAAPLVIYFALGDRAQTTLGALKDWMSHNNAVIMALICLIIGVKLIGDAVAALSG